MMGGGGTGGGRPGEKGAGGVREKREKRGREAGFPRWREAGEKKGKITQHCAIFRIEKCKGAGDKKIQGGNRD